MGSGYGGIYSGTAGGVRYGKGQPLGLTAELPDSQQVMAAMLALAGVEMLGSQMGPLSDEAFLQIQAMVQAAISSGTLGEALGMPEVPEEHISKRGEAVAADIVAKMVAWHAAELGIDLRTDPDDPRPGIYENCRFAEAALGLVLPGTVPGSDPTESVPRFAFHEEEGGHFGVDDNTREESEDGQRSQKGKAPIYVMENCSEIGGTRVAGWALFVALGRGGTPKPLRDNREGGTGEYKGFGFLCELADGTTVVWRWETFTKSSPALEIRTVPAGVPVANHKVHLYEGPSSHRK